MGGSEPLSVFSSTIPAMKKLSDMYKLYRELPVFQALYQSLLELGQQELLPMELIPAIVHTYDQTVVDMVRDSKDQYNLTGKLVMYRILQDNCWCVLSNVTVYLQPPVTPDTATTSGKKGKKVVKMGKRLGRFDKIKIWCHDPINDSSLVQVDTGNNNSPYAIEVEKKQKMVEKKKKLNLSKKVTAPIGGYNPLTHTTLLGTKDKGVHKQVFSHPMPYNEKLRRGGVENSLSIAESQVGRVEVMKGRYRKKAKEYPYRCVEMEERRPVDLRVVTGRNMVRRNYLTLMKSQDRFLAEMADGAGGTLAMTAHNIHVAEEDRLGEEREVVRESYGTRRKNKIEHATFDTVNKYAVVKEIPKKRVDTDSETSDSVTSEEGFSSPEQFVVRETRVDESSLIFEKCRPRSRQKDNLSVRLGIEEEGKIFVKNDLFNGEDEIGKEVSHASVSERMEDEFDFLDDLVKEKLQDDFAQDDQLAIDKMLDLALNGTNNRDIDELPAEQMDLENNQVLKDCFDGADLDLFNSQHDDLFPATSFVDLNQTLDTDI
eukprot:GFUD01043655.1.p1 GENE.GFUD01043655.1~~GFUD01043655.1.p1  ORF type:complete len:543 (+),score=185.92 GFUD01043655.1:79-1707(+)